MYNCTNHSLTCVIYGKNINKIVVCISLKWLKKLFSMGYVLLFISKLTKVLFYENLRHFLILETFKLNFIVILFLIKVKSKYKNETVVKIISTKVMTKI